MRIPEPAGAPLSSQVRQFTISRQGRIITFSYVPFFVMFNA